MAKWPFKFGIPKERQECRIKADFDMDSPELARILGEARAQENTVEYPCVMHNNHRWLLISESLDFHNKRASIELLHIETPIACDQAKEQR